MAKIRFRLPTDEPIKKSTKEIVNKDRRWIKILAVISIIELLIIAFLLHK